MPSKNLHLSYFADCPDSYSLRACAGGGIDPRARKRDRATRLSRALTASTRDEPMGAMAR